MIHRGPGITSGIALYPSRKKVIELLDKIKIVIDKSQNANAFELIATLNPILRGWLNYFNLGNSSHLKQIVGQAIFRKIVS